MTGVVSYSFIHYDLIERVHVKDLSKQYSSGFFRAAGACFQGFSQHQVDAIRKQFNRIDFYQIDRIPGFSPAPVKAYEDSKTLKVFLDINKNHDFDAVLKFIFSSLMVVALDIKRCPPDEQNTALKNATEAFLTKLPYKITVSSAAFAGLTLMPGIDLFKEAIFWIAQHKAFLHPPLIESNCWEGTWDSDQLASLYKGLSLQYAKSASFRNVPNVKEMITKLPIPFFPPDQLQKKPSDISQSLQTLLKIGVISALFDPIKEELDANEAALFVNGPVGTTFLKFLWGTRKVIVLCAGGFSGDLKQDFALLLKIFQKSLYIPNSLQIK